MVGACGAHLPLEAEEYTVRIDTGGLRGAEPDALEVFFNGRRLRGEELEIGLREVTFRISPEVFVEGREQRLGFACPPLPVTPGETRKLGLPLVTIDFERPVSPLAMHSAALAA